MVYGQAARGVTSTSGGRSRATTIVSNVTFAAIIPQQKSLRCSDMNAIQCKMARVALGWGVRELAQIAQVSTQTVARFERGDHLRDRTVQSLRSAFEQAGIEFIPENGGGPGLRINKKA
jgi:DNA-binding XRE family transcriptional regulator